LYFPQQLLVLLLVLPLKLKLAGLAKKLNSTLVIAWREARQPEIKKYADGEDEPEFQVDQ